MERFFSSLKTERTARKGRQDEGRLHGRRTASTGTGAFRHNLVGLVEEAHLTLRGEVDGEIVFGALKGFVDVRDDSGDDSACAQFSWEGRDENHPASGRGQVSSAQ